MHPLESVAWDLKIIISQQGVFISQYVWQDTTYPYILIHSLKCSSCQEAKALKRNFQCFATLSTGPPSDLASDLKGGMVKTKPAIFMLCRFLIMSKSWNWNYLWIWNYSWSHPASGIIWLMFFIISSKNQHTSSHQPNDLDWQCHVTRTRRENIILTWLYMQPTPI